MTLQIEEGKFYRNRIGDKVGPMQKNGASHLQSGMRGEQYPWTAELEPTFTDEGRVSYDTSFDHELDLVAEWIDKPIPAKMLPYITQSKDEPGHKFDAGKPRLDLIAPEFLTGTADILAFGAEKYGERNWEAGMSWSRPFAALMRHMWAWWSGEEKDAETGKSHLWHAACCLMFLIAFEARNTGKDDRAKISS